MNKNYIANLMRKEAFENFDLKGRPPIPPSLLESLSSVSWLINILNSVVYGCNSKLKTFRIFIESLKLFQNESIFGLSTKVYYTNNGLVRIFERQTK